MLVPKRNDRVGMRIKNNLGIIRYNNTLNHSKEGFVYRNKDLHKYDLYYENKQHDDKQPWDQSCDSADYVQIRKRQPRIQFPFSKVLASRVVGKLVGQDTWPTFVAEQDPDTDAYLRWIIKVSHLQTNLFEPLRRMMVSGSVFVRFGVINGAFALKYELAKHCYPTLAPDGSLESMTVAYVYEDKEDVDHNQKPKKKWYRADYGPDADILFEPVLYVKGQKLDEVEWTIAETAEHGLGFVQGEWFRTFVGSEGIDGASLIADILDFMDEIDYNMSQSSQVIQYNQDPQLLIKGLTEDDLETLVRSSQKAWNLGREGEASFLETGLQAVEVARDFRDRVRLSVQDIARIVLMDPEKMASHAQSGRALEILHQPMVELIQELRPSIEMALVSLVRKMALVNLLIANSGGSSPVSVPPGYQPKTLQIDLKWPAVFAKSIEDLQKKVSVASQVSSAKLISRETLTRWLAQDFQIEDVELELQKIAAEPVLNPFGGF
jgi:hypothetical protein